MRRKSTPYEGTGLCEYCNKHQATHTLVCGKLCCSSTAGNCKERRKAAGKKISASRNTIVDGLSNGQRIAAKIAENKRNDIDDSGLNMHQRSALKVAAIKASKIDPETGLNVHQLTGIKSSEWYKTPEGKIIKERQAKENSKRLSEIDPETGLTESKRRAKIMVETKLNNIDENGLNGFDRTHWVGGKGGFVDGIYYQSSNEKRFLETMSATLTTSSITRGKSIHYTVDGSEHRYIPDYIIGDRLFEVKSKYTMFGPNNKFLKTNVAKLDAALKSGYIVFVVIDDETILYPTFRSSIANLLES